MRKRKPRTAELSNANYHVLLCSRIRYSRIVPVSYKKIQHTLVILTHPSTHVSSKTPNWNVSLKSNETRDKRGFGKCHRVDTRMQSPNNCLTNAHILYCCWIWSLWFLCVLSRQIIFSKSKGGLISSWQNPILIFFQNFRPRCKGCSQLITFKQDYSLLGEEHMKFSLKTF